MSTVYRSIKDYHICIRYSSIWTFATNSCLSDRICS